MSDYFYVKYGGASVTNAQNIKFTELLNARDTFSFQVPNFYNQNFETWEGRIDGDIELYDSIGSDTLRCKGYVDSVTAGNPLVVNCISDDGKLAWWLIKETESNMADHTLYVNATPPTSAGKYHKGMPKIQLTGGTDDWDTWTEGGDCVLERNINGYGLAAKMPSNADKINRTGLASTGHTCEFNFCIDNIGTDFELDFEDVGNNESFKVYTDTGVLKFSSNAGLDVLINPMVINTWYNIRVDWRVSLDEVDVYVDEVKIIDAEAFTNNANIDEIKVIRTDGTGNLYFDGLGYDADSDFTAGDSVTHIYGEIRLVDDEGADPNITEDTYNNITGAPRYAIISDVTLGTNSKTGLQSEATSNTANETDETNTHTATQTLEGTYWKVANDAADTNRLSMWLGIDVEDSNIPDTANITNIKITLDGQIKVNDYIFRAPAVFDIYWSANNTLNTSTDTLIHSVSVTPDYVLGTSKTKTFSIPPDHPVVLSEADNDNETFFIKAGGEWTEGYLFIYQRDLLDTATAETKIWVDYFSVDIEYESATYDQVNKRILLQGDEADEYTFLFLQDDTTTTEMYDLVNTGIAETDKVIIGCSYDEAYERCFSGQHAQSLGYITNDGDEIAKGIGNNFGVQSSLNICEQLNEQLDYVYFNDYDTGIGIIINAMNEDDIDNAAVTYASGVDPPSDWNLTTGEEYGYVQVQYKGGITPLVEASSSPSTSPRQKLVIAKHILTFAEAMHLAQTLADRLKTRQMSLSVVWDYMPTNIPHVGTKYSFNFNKYDGSDLTNTIDYTNQLCRLVTWEQDGAQGAWRLRAEFGRHATTGQEQLGKDIGTLYNMINRDRALSLTAEFSPLTRHGQLGGIGTSDHHVKTVKYTDAEVDAIVATHAADGDAHGDQFVIASMDMFKGTGDEGTAGFIELTANEYMFGHFFLSEYAVNTNQALRLILVIYSNDADATYAMASSIGAIETDNTQAFSWNVESAFARTFDGDPVSQPAYIQATVEAADIANNDLLRWKMLNNEAGKTVRIRGMFVIYEQVEAS